MVKGSLQIQNNKNAIVIGSSSASCPGNHIGGNLQVTSNSGSTQVFDNTLQGNLQCSSNSSISGGGNFVKGNKQGQCSSF
jgi:hypothetical protein